MFLLKKSGRMLAVFLAAIMMLPVFATASFRADAASDTLINITIDKVTRKYREAAKWLGYINNLRAQNNLSTLVMDVDLLETAMVRSAELSVYVGARRLDGSEFVTSGNDDRSESYAYALEDDVIQQSSFITTRNTTLIKSNSKSIGVGYIENNSGCKFLTVLTSDKTPNEVSSSTLSQSNSKIDQSVKCKTSYLTDIRLNFANNQKIICGNKAVLRYTVTNQGDRNIEQYISAPSKVTSTDQNVFVVNEDNSIIGVSAGYSTITMSMTGVSDMSVKADLEAIVRTMADCTVSPIPDQIYSGTSITPSVTITNSSGKTLAVGTDYRLTYVNNINVGTACVVITGLGTYANHTTSVSFKIVDNKQVFAATLNTNKSDMELGETVKLIAASANGTGTVKYLYEYCPDGSTSYTTIQSASTATSCSFKPSAKGLYHLRVTATDGAGKKATATADVTAHQALKTSITLSSTQVSIGEAVTVKGGASGGITPYSYKISVMLPGSSTYTTLKDYNTTSSYIYKPEKSGTHMLRFECKDNYGSVNYSEAGLNVSGGSSTNEFTNTSTLGATSVQSGQSVVFNGSATGGKAGYTFEYLYKISTASSWTNIANGYTKSTSAVVIPTTKGTYNAKINAKDGNGTVKTKTFTFTVTASDTSFANKSSVSATSILIGEKITLNGAAVNGTTPYSYAYYYKKNTGSSWVTLGTEYGTATSVKIKPSAAVPYDVMINVKDKSGNVKSKYFSIKVKPSALVNNSTVSAESIVLGQSVKLNGLAVGGTGKYTYALLYKKSTSSSWVTIGTKYGTDSTGSFKPGSAVSYDVMINVKDSAGTVKSKTFTVKVSAAGQTLTNKSTVSATAITLGKSITLRGAATGGTGKYTYALLYKKSSATSWITIGTKYSSAYLGSFTPGKAVKYDVMINVKDSAGTIKTKTFTVKVIEGALANNSTISASTVKKGTTVTLYGSAYGGTGKYTYALLYKKSSASSWNCIGTKYGTASSGSFVPGSAVKYDIMINVKDSAGTTKSKTFTLNVTS